MPGGDNKKRSVVVLGAGVIGLSIAHALTSETLAVHNDGNDDDDDVLATRKHMGELGR